MIYLQETHLRSKEKHRLKVKGWKKIFHANWKGKKSKVAVIISDKIDFKTKAIIKDKEGHYIMRKGMIQQEDITLINIHALNIGAAKYVRQIFMDIKGEINRSTVIVGDLNTTLTWIDRSSRQKLKKETAVLNSTLDQMDLIDIFRALHPKAAEYTYFSNTHRMFSWTDHMLCKTSFNKFKKFEILSSIFTDHHAMKL